MTYTIYSCDCRGEAAAVLVFKDRLTWRLVFVRQRALSAWATSEMGTLRRLCLASASLCRKQLSGNR